jgi:hypothetical protein
MKRPRYFSRIDGKLHYDGFPLSTDTPPARLLAAIESALGAAHHYQIEAQRYRETLQDVRRPIIDWRSRGQAGSLLVAAFGAGMAVSALIRIVVGV